MSSSISILYLTILVRTNGFSDGIQKDIIVVTARLPHGKASQASFVNVFAFGGCVNEVRCVSRETWQWTEVEYAPKEIASSYETITCVLGLYTYGCENKSRLA